MGRVRVGKNILVPRSQNLCAVWLIFVWYAGIFVLVLIRFYSSLLIVLVMVNLKSLWSSESIFSIIVLQRLTQAWKLNRRLWIDVKPSQKRTRASSMYLDIHVNFSTFFIFILSFHSHILFTSGSHYLVTSICKSGAPNALKESLISYRSSK